VAVQLDSSHGESSKVNVKRAVILAGGMGTRLRPYTAVLPKPLVPVADRPILELVIRQLARHGFTHVELSVGHLGGLIKAYLDQGPFLAMNGDVLTTLDFDQLMRFHAGNDAGLTIATHRQNVDVALGVIESEDGYVTEYVEKPTVRFDVSMGIYAYDPDVLELIPERRFDFPDVVHALIAAERKVAVYTGPGVWFDIGTVGEHERAVAELEAHPELFEDA
jgi:NDP-sugar pyrophosphorylase family protein